MKRYFSTTQQAPSKTKLSYFIALLILCLPGLTFADIDAPEPVLITHNVGMLANIAQYFSIGAGVSLFLGGLLKLKRYGEMRTMMSTHITIAAPLFMLLAGVALLYLPTVLESSLYAVWGTANPLAIPTIGVPGVNSMLPPVVMFIRFIGVCSFIRGWLMVSRMGKEGGQPGMVGKAFMHIFGGVMCVHIVGTAHLIKQLLGFVG